MKHTPVLLVVTTAVVLGLVGLPAEASTPGRVAAPAPAVVVDAATPEFGCDMPMPSPFTKYMSRFTRTGNCFERFWTLTGWVEPGDDARALLKGWRTVLRTSAYHVDGGISCRWSGATRICSQTIVMNSGYGYGGITTKVGPIRDGGTRGAVVRVRMGYGG